LNTLKGSKHYTAPGTIKTPEASRRFLGVNCKCTTLVPFVRYVLRSAGDFSIGAPGIGEGAGAEGSLSSEGRVVFHNRT
jgi:hypothetical protein